MRSCNTVYFELANRMFNREVNLRERRELEHQGRGSSRERGGRRSRRSSSSPR